MTKLSIPFEPISVGCIVAEAAGLIEEKNSTSKRNEQTDIVNH